MVEPLRVLVVEHCNTDRGIAAQLFTNYDLDFSWRCIASLRAYVKQQPPLKEHSILGANLREAIHRHALRVQYQPQFELDTGRGCGVEALARWTLSTDQVIAPSVFIAEGVETEQPFQMLEDLGCPRVHAYLLERPISPKQAQLALRTAWGNRPSPNPAFGRGKIAVGELLVQ
jgi:predicted signal transduction protein with EAL and GGDEF domain